MKKRKAFDNLSFGHVVKYAGRYKGLIFVEVVCPSESKSKKEPFTMYQWEEGNWPQLNGHKLGKDFDHNDMICLNCTDEKNILSIENIGSAQ
jgi:hypothetical protein